MPRMIPLNLARFACIMLVLALLAQPAYADTISNAIIPIQGCNAEDDAAAAGTFGGACDFPDGSALIANGGNTETHSAARSVTRYWGGVNTTSYNSTETECIAITSVSVCYEWWHSAGGQDCDISVDANGGASYTAITTTCPGTGANPGVTCYNATATEAWSCSSFFGASGTRSQIKSEGRKSGGNGAQTYTWDVLYYNVTYRRDREAPVITLISPANASTWNSSNTVLFQYNVTDDSAIANCSLIINGTVNQTNYAVVRNATQNFSQSLANGNYTWRVNCTDNSTNKNNGTSALRNLEVYVPVDNAPPVVTPVSPADASTWNSSNTVLFQYNVTDALSGIASCSLIINGTVNQTNYTVTEGATQDFSQSLANGNYTWSVNCTDDSPNSNQGASATRALQVYVMDTAPPVITLLSPANASNWNASNIVLFQYNVTDIASAIANCSLIINSSAYQTDTSVSEGATQDFSQSLANGNYTWSVNCTDDSVNKNMGASATRTLTVSADPPPNVTNVMAYPQSLPPNSGTNISAVVVDNGVVDEVVFEIRYPNSTKVNFTIIPEYSDEFNSGALSPKWTWYNEPAAWDVGTSLAGHLRITADSTTDFWGNDNTGHFLYRNVTGNFSVISKINATPATAYQKIGLMVRQDVNDWVDIMKEYDAAVQISTDTDVAGTSTDVATTVTGPNPYWVRIDREGNTFRTYYSSDGANWTSHYNYTPAIAYPSTVEVGMAIATGTSATQITGYYDYINLTGGQAANGDISGAGNYTLFFNDTSQTGTYNVTIIANDTLGSVNNTETTWFDVAADTTAPAITLISPADASTWNSSNTVLFQYNVTDALSGIAGCSLIINGTVNQTNYTITEGATQNFTASLLNGNYTWSVNCTDDSLNSNQGASATRTLEVSGPVDAISPVVNLISPSNSSIWNATDTVAFEYNVTDADSSVAFCEFIVNGIVLATDYTVTEGDTQNFLWDMINGTYTWSVNCTDTSIYANEGASQTRSLTVAVPLRRTVFLNGFEDSSGTGTTGFSGVWSVEYGTDANEAQIQNTIVRNGAYAARMEEGDEGEVAISIAPNQLNLSSYTNCVLNYSFRLSANWDATDYMYVDVYDGSWHYGVVTLVGTGYTAGIWYNLSLSLSNYSMVDDFRVRFDQEANNDNEQSNWDDIIITCDRNFVMPNVTLISPANGSTWNSSSTVTFEYNVTDADNSILFCALVLNNSIVDYDFTITEGITQNFTRVLSSGSYTWRVNCTDYTLYRGASGIWSLTVAQPVPYVFTDLDTYESCGTVFYKVWAYNQNDALIDSNLTISIYNTTSALQNATNASTGNGGTGIYLGNYSLDVSDELGSWLIEALAEGIVKGTQDFFIGTAQTKWKIDIDFSPDSIVYLNGTAVTMNFTVWTKEGIRQTGLLPGGISVLIDSANVTSSLSASGEGYAYSYTANATGMHTVTTASGDVANIRGFKVE